MTDIRTGYPTMGMLPFGVGQPPTDDQVLQLASYVLSKRGTLPQSEPLEADRDNRAPEMAHR